MSDAVASVVNPAARAAPAPPDDPPGEVCGFHGLRVTPHMGEWVTVAQLNSGLVVRAWMMPPAALIRSTTGWSCSATRPRCAASPCSRRRPAMPCFSLVATVSPSSGGGSSPDAA